MLGSIISKTQTSSAAFSPPPAQLRPMKVTEHRGPAQSSQEGPGRGQPTPAPAGAAGLAQAWPHLGLGAFGQGHCAQCLDFLVALFLQGDFYWWPLTIPGRQRPRPFLARPWRGWRGCCQFFQDCLVLRALNRSPMTPRDTVLSSHRRRETIRCSKACLCSLESTCNFVSLFTEEGNERQHFLFKVTYNASGRPGPHAKLFLFHAPEKTLGHARLEAPASRPGL